MADGFHIYQVDRATGEIVAELQGHVIGNARLELAASVGPAIEVVDAAAYQLTVTGVPLTAALGSPIQFKVGWQQINPTTDPSPTSPLAVEIDGKSFPHTLDPTTNQATITVVTEVAGPLSIRVGGQLFVVEVS